MNSKIYTNMDSIRNYNVFNKNQAAASKAMAHATTGLKIGAVADSPSDWAISQKMRERTNSLNQVSQNIQNDDALAKTAADGIANTLNVLNTLKARVLHGADAATTDQDRANIVKEITTLFGQIDGNAEQVKYNGMALLDGTFGTTDGEGGGEGGDIVAVNADGEASESTITFQVGDQAGMTIELKIGSMKAEDLGLESAEFVAANMKDTDEAKKLLESVDAAIETVLNAATDIGSVQQRLGYTADNVNTQIENLQASDSAIRDADMAKEISDYLKFNVLAQASRYMLAQSNQNAYSVLNLLLQ